MCARQRTFFSCAHKKRRQKKAPLLPVSLRCAKGNLRCSRQGRGLLNSRRAARSAQTTQPARSGCVPMLRWGRPPLPLRFSERAQGGLGNTTRLGLRPSPSSLAFPCLAPSVFAIAHACGLPVLVYTLQLYFAYRLINRPLSPVNPAVAAINFGA